MALGEICDDCAGFDVAGLRRCDKHNRKYCHTCQCPECAEDDQEWDDYEEDGPMDLEDRLDGLLNKPAGDAK